MLEHNAIMERLLVLPNFYVPVFDAQGAPTQGYTINMQTVLAELAINENLLHQQLALVSAHIAEWGRLSALAKRVVQYHEHCFRQWKAKMFVDLSESTEKKLTQAKIDATIRTLPEYRVFYETIEQAEENYNASLAILDGFRAQRDILKSSVYRQHETNAPKMSV